MLCVVCYMVRCTLQHVRRRVRIEQSGSAWRLRSRSSRMSSHRSERALHTSRERASVAAPFTAMRTTHARECAAAPTARSVADGTVLREGCQRRRVGVRYWWCCATVRRARSYSLLLAQIQPIFSRMIDVHAAFAPAVRPLPCRAPPPLRRGEGGRAERARVVRRRMAARALPLGLARLVGLSQTWLWWCWRSVRSAPVPLADRTG